MRACEVVYDAPARFDDLLDVFPRTKRIGRTSLTSEYCSVRVANDALMCTAEQTLVLVHPGERRAVPVPDGYRRALEEFEGADVQVATAR